MAIGQSQGVDGRYVEPTSHPTDKATYEDELTDMMDTGITLDSDDEEEEGQSNHLPPNLPIKRFVSLCVEGLWAFLHILKHRRRQRSSRWQKGTW